MAKPLSKVALLKNVTIYSTFLVVFWAFYRFLFQFPDDFTELVIKPIVWLLPLLFILKKEKMGIGSLGITYKNLFPAVYLSLGLGAVFLCEALFANYFKYGGFYFGASLGAAAFIPSLLLSFATAFSEEISFRGYIFNRLQMVFKTDLGANIIQTLLWTIIHVPVAFFVFKMGMTEGIVYLCITAIFGLGSAFIFGRTKNIFGSILLHVLWQWPIILFR